jgi:hypothetical protein
MAKKPTKSAPTWPKPPFLMADSAMYIAKPIVVVERSINAWRGVYYSIAALGGDGAVVDKVMRDDQCGFAGKQYTLQTNAIEGWNEKSDRPIIRTHVQNMRRNALEHGATPEAIRLLHGIQPFTQREMDDMTNKLSKKASGGGKKADAAAKGNGKKTDAKATGGKKGNAEALKKAREAKNAPDTRVITVKKKENPYREGSNRAASFAALKTGQTVDEYKKAGGKVKYISRWAADGTISLK